MFGPRILTMLHCSRMACVRALVGSVVSALPLSAYLRSLPSVASARVDPQSQKRSLDLLKLTEVSIEVPCLSSVCSVSRFIDLSHEARLVLW